jgi:hypothetical protein
MAEEIGFQVKVSGADSLSSLKKEFKDLQAELERTEVGTEEYTKTLAKLGRVKDDIGDLKDTINALNPEGKVAAFQNVAGKLAGGFQAATGAAALFGVKSEELEATLLRVQAATAFAEGITSLAGLSDAFNVVGTVIKTQVITALSTLKGALIATGIGAAVVALGALVYAANEYNETLQEEIDKQGKLNDELKKTTELYDKNAEKREGIRNAQKGGLNDLERELKLLEAQGASITEIADKRKAIIDAELFNLKVRRNAVEGNAELESKYTQDILDKQNERLVVEAQLAKQIADNAPKRANIAKEEIEDKREKIEYTLMEGDAISMIAARQEQEALAEQERLKLVAKLEAENQAIRVANFLEEEKLRKEREAAEKLQADTKLQAEENYFNAAQGLSEAFFQTQLNMAQGNDAETEKIRKKQFQAEKAFSVARAIIDGYRAVNAALVIPPPAGPILAASNALLAAASVAKILSTQYNSGSTPAGGGGGNLALPSGSGNQSIPMPTIAAPVNPQASTQLNAQGYNVSKVVVVEKDITTVQNRINRLKVQATY